MPGLDDYTPRPHRRTLDEARKCKFLGLRLTQAEVDANRLMGCRTCNNEVPAFHCSHTSHGPFTMLAGDCTSCLGFALRSLDLKPVVDVAETTPPVG
jgi:hypothetical protein